MECPKCGHTSGDSWLQCEGKCPMPMSPHYDSSIDNTGTAIFAILSGPKVSMLIDLRIPKAGQVWHTQDERRRWQVMATFTDIYGIERVVIQPLPKHPNKYHAKMACKVVTRRYLRDLVLEDL